MDTEEKFTFRKEIPLSGGWDVIVVGGGPGGCAAAIAAARAGARTLLLEGTGSAGGMATGGLVPAWCPFSDGEKILYRGIAETVFNRAKAHVAHAGKADLDWVAIDPEALKRVYDDLLIRYGVKVLFQTAVAGVEKKSDGTVDAVIAGNKAGLTAFRGKIFVDGTGDGDLAAWSGAEWEMGDPVTGEFQHASLCFTLSNVDSYYYKFSGTLQERNPDSPVRQMEADPEFPEISSRHICQNFIGPGTVGFNAGHLRNVDATDPESLTRAMMEGRKTADAYLRALQKYAPRSFGSAFLVCTANLMGIRESRRIMGEYVFTVDDYLERRSFGDEIGRNCYYLDIHGMKGKLAELSEKSRYRPGESHGISYRMLLPKKLDNLLVCGRCISTDRASSGSLRVMPVCLVTGEAAGTAAALAARQNVSPKEIDTVLLRKTLRENGAYFLN